MPAQLERSIKRYIALSGDDKPRWASEWPDGEALSNNERLPPGASVMEADTGVKWLWTGRTWLPTPDPHKDLLKELNDKMERLLLLLQIATKIEV